MGKRKKTWITWAVMVVIAVAAVVGYFVISSKKNDDNYEPEAVQTEVSKLLEKNLDSAYPVTPREVVKLYSRIMKCFYNEELETEQMEGLTDQLRRLFDAQLLAANPREEHLTELQEEIRSYAAHKRTVTSYQVEASNNVVEWTLDGQEFARLIAAYTEKEDTQYLKVYEEFVLRKDADGKWKIVGWKLANEEDMQ